MATTRGRSAQGSSSPAASQSSTNSNTGKKRTAESDNASAPKAKRGRPSKKQQKTIEETIDGGEEHPNSGAEDTEMKNGNSEEFVEDDKVVAEQINGKSEGEKKEGEADESQVQNGTEKAENEVHKQSEQKNAFDEVKADESEVKKAAAEEQEKKSENIQQNNKSIIEDEKREAEIPSSILEKGIIYFFFRSRVNIDEPQGIEDVARSYIVLRPLPLGAKLGDGPLEDTGNARLLALPKKMLPKSHSDRFLAFVEKGEAFIKDLRDQFSGNEYPTKTSGYSCFHLSPVNKTN